MQKLKFKKKILIGPSEIAGNAHSLKKALNLIGEDCTIFLTKPHPHHEPICFIQKLHIFVSKIDVLIIRKLFRLGVYFIEYLMALYYIATKDVFIFYFGDSFLPFYIDLKIIKLLNKRSIMQFCGSDSRCPLIDGGLIRNLNAEDAVSLTNETIKKLRIIEKYCDDILVNPFSAQLHEKKFINDHLVGLPYFKNSSKINKSQKSEKLQILHAPSHVFAKGSKKIEAIVKELEKDYPVKYVELKNVPHSKVAEKLADTDIVIDQLYCDAAVAGLTTEALCFGKPVFVGSYVSKEEIEKYSPLPLDFVIMLHPDNLKKTLIDYLENPEKLAEISLETQKYLKVFLNSEAIAKRWKSIIYNNVSENWYVQSKDIDYMMGWGVSEKYLKTKLKEINVDFNKVNLDDDHPLIEYLKKVSGSV